MSRGYVLIDSPGDKPDYGRTYLFNF